MANENQVRYTQRKARETNFDSCTWYKKEIVFYIYCDVEVWKCVQRLSMKLSKAGKIQITGHGIVNYKLV
jgi:hypothetical protein